MGQLHTDGGRQAIAHRAESARRHPAVRILEMEVLGGPHLVLADFRGDVGVPLPRQFVQAWTAYCGLITVSELRKARLFFLRHSLIWRHQSFTSGCALAFLAFQSFSISFSTLPASPTMPTSTLTFLLRTTDQCRYGCGRRWAMRPPRRRREGIEPSRDTVVETRADIDDHIRAVHHEVGLIGPVHAQHAQPLRIAAGNAPRPIASMSPGNPSPSRTRAACAKPRAQR